MALIPGETAGSPNASDMVWCNSMNSDRKYVEGHAPKPADFFLTRRQFLQRAGMGFGALGLATLLAEDCLGAAPVQDAEPLSALAPRSPHFPAKAKHVVHIFAQGAPSHVDTFDPKRSEEHTSELQSHVN